MEPRPAHKVDEQADHFVSILLPEPFRHRPGFHRDPDLRLGLQPEGLDERENLRRLLGTSTIPQILHQDARAGNAANDRPGRSTKLLQKAEEDVHDKSPAKNATDSRK